MAWLTETEPPGGEIVFTIRQHKYRPFKNLLKLVFAGSIIIGIFLVLMKVIDPILSLFALLFGVIFGFAWLLGLVVALSAGLARRGSTKISINSKTLIIHSGSKQELPKDQISAIYAFLHGAQQVDKGNRYDRGGAMITLPGRASASAGQTSGQLAISVLKDCSSYVAVNFRGKKVKLAKYLMDDEASYLLARIKPHLEAV